MTETTNRGVVRPGGQRRDTRGQASRTRRASRNLTYTEAIRATRLSVPVMLCGTVLILSYLLRMTIIPWPLPRDVTNYAAIVLACMAAIGLMKQVVPLYLMGLLLTLPSVFSSPNFEDSGLRWVGWGLLFVAVGPILSGAKVFRFRMFMMLVFFVLLHLSAIGSGLAGLVGFQVGGGRGTFWGLLSHSNMLGPVASLAAVDSFSKWSASHPGRARTIWLCLMLLELATSMRAASRGALLGFVVGSAICTLISDARTKGKLAFTLVLVIFIASGYQFIKDSERRYVTDEKGLLSNLSHKGLTNTRERLWTERIGEFQSSPLTGVGFCMGGPDAMRVREDGFMQEPGSSYLAALSMTGVVGCIGFLIMISPLITATFRMATKRYGPRPPLYVYTASFWLVAMLTEGFAHYVGSPFCFASFLWCGVCADAQNLYPNVDPLRVRI